jgi:hypothetical protein
VVRLRLVRALLLVLGLVALVFGLIGVLFGTAGVSGPDEASVNVDSEFRYFAAWYAGAGGLLLWQSRQPRPSRQLIAVLDGALLLGVLGRVISRIDVGTPDGWVTALTVVELVLAVVVVPWAWWALGRRSPERAH